MGDYPFIYIYIILYKKYINQISPRKYKYNVIGSIICILLNEHIIFLSVYMKIIFKFTRY